MKVATAAAGLLALLLSTDSARTRSQAERTLSPIVHVWPVWKIHRGLPPDFVIDDPEGAAEAIKALDAELLRLTAADATHLGK